MVRRVALCEIDLAYQGIALGMPDRPGAISIRKQKSP
jgi:hypothetical protein